MRCLRCGAESATGRRFCAACGTPFSIQCPKCGAGNAPSSAFCEDCGAPLASAAIQLSGDEHPVVPHQQEGPSRPEGERKIVTALFADLKGSTELLETLDPEEGRAIVEPRLRIMCDAVRRYEGYLVRTTGDGIFALFGAPVAYEDHPQRALYAALQMQQELRTYGQAQSVNGHPVLDTRVGVHTGEVVAYPGEASGKVEYRLIGHTANLASRIESLAPSGSIAVSEDTRKLCEGYFELRELGPATVNGVSTPVNVYEVLGPGALRSHFELSTRRGLTLFVGRERELEQMLQALNQASDGHGQIVAVVAEAGTGKSRLFYEFKAMIPAECKVVEAYSVSHGKASAWLPVLELLRGYFGIVETDDPAARRDKLRRSLLGLDPGLEDTLPYLFGLLGFVEGADPLAQMDPQIKRQRTLDAIKRIVVRESLKQPLVLIFEDLHWIDEQTQALLDLMVDSVASARVLLLFNSRPEYRHGWGNKSYYSQLALTALDESGTALMMTSLLGNAVELNPLRRLIAERTAGNPFFIEEMVQALFDEGALVRNGAVKVTRSLSQLRLPPTVQGMLAARIDRLPAKRKELLQTLAVIGREAPLGLVQRVVADEVGLSQGLAELRSGEFIYEQPVAGDPEFVFKHALTQEVAYNSLLIERRKQLHERSGEAIESLFTDQIDDHIAQLAHHFSLSDNADKAIEYLGRAGHQALQRSAHTEAISDLNAAIDLLRTLPDSSEHLQKELQLQLAIGPAFIAIKGWSGLEVEQIYTRARSLCERLDDPPDTFSVLFGLYASYLLRGELRQAHELAGQLLSRAESVSDPTLLLIAHQALGQTSFQKGDLLLARKHLERVISLYDRERHRQLAFLSGLDFGVAGLSYAAETLWFLGYPDQALQRVEEARALCRELSHPHTSAFAGFFSSLVSQYRRETLAVCESSERGLVLCAERGFTAQLALTNILSGWVVAKQGRHEEGIKLLTEGLAAFRTTRGELARPYWLLLLADAYREAGRFDDSMALLAEALMVGYRQEDLLNAAEIFRLKGELLLKQNESNATEAQSCFERAIEIARGQSAKSWELRATTSLARLLRQQGRRDQARTMLAEIYNWFTEGFDTADLKDAKALLDELSA